MRLGLRADLERAPRRRADGDQMDLTVCAEAGAASRAAARISSAEAPTSSFSRASSAGASDSLKLASWQPKLSPKVASSECRV